MLGMISKVKEDSKYTRNNPNYNKRSKKNHVNKGLKRVRKGYTKRKSLKYIKNLLKQFWNHLNVIRKNFEDTSESFNRDKRSQKVP